MEEKGDPRKSPASTSRRKFVKQLGGGAALAAATGIGSMGCQTTGGRITWSETFDWISIGSGFAGCAAAIFGHDQGFQTLLLEKADKVGGLTIECSRDLTTGSFLLREMPTKQLHDQSSHPYAARLAFFRSCSLRNFLRMRIDLGVTSTSSSSLMNSSAYSSVV